MTVKTKLHFHVTGGGVSPPAVWYYLAYLCLPGWLGSWGYAFLLYRKISGIETELLVRKVEEFDRQ